MNKLLVFLAVFSVLLGVFGVVGVMAVEQGAEGAVIPDLTLIPTPNPVVFGPLIPRTSDTERITLTPGHSNLIVTVDVSDTVGTLFEDGLAFDFGAGPVDPEALLIPVMADTPIMFDAILTVPTAIHSGAYSGKITYTVMEAP